MAADSELLVSIEVVVAKLPTNHLMHPHLAVHQLAWSWLWKFGEKHALHLRHLHYKKRGSLVSNVVWVAQLALEKYDTE